MKNLLLLLLLSIVVSSCSNNENIVAPTPEAIQKIKLAEGYAAGSKIELYADDTLRTGYSRFYIRVLDSATNAVVRNAHIEATPEMDMTSMKHSCPTEQTPQTLIVGDLFPLAAVFAMPESKDHKWSMHIQFHNHVNDKEGMVVFPISVVSGAYPAKSLMTKDGARMILAMLPIEKPVVGMNNIEFVVFAAAGDDYTPISDLTTEMTPEMPSMGHGSPNNVNPLSIGNGHYAGKVNFIMTGEWKINLALRRADAEIGLQYFMITL